ncbi:MAG: WXG100 family type VII secretion target [Nocardioidaceae bacterium]|nr:WXG100 family type VII secretion target [Nocardioidaceae bacterium]NUS49989.1 WXG100 family type VII secretion target [Nocardioidaceae bacterium]
MTDHYHLDIHPDDLRKASKALNRLAEHSDTKGKTVTGTPGEIGDQWTGKAATSIKAEMTGLGQTMTGFVAKLDACKGAVDGLADDYDEATRTLNSLNTRWQAAQDAYTTAVNKADSDQRSANQRLNSGDKPPTQADQNQVNTDHANAVVTAASTRDTAVGKLDTEFEQLKTHLQTRTKNAGTKIADNGVPIPVPPSTIEAYQHGYCYPVTLDHSSLESSLALTKQFEDQRIDLDIEAKGKTAAEQLMNSNGDISPELIAQIHEQSGNPYFAYGLASNVDPQQLNAVLSAYDVRLRESGDYPAEEIAKRNNAAIMAIGTTLGTATQGDGELTLPPDFETTWAAAITETPYTQKDGTAPPNQAQRLGLLMEQGTWGTGFLAGISSDLYDFERAHQDDHPWSSRSGIEKLVGPDGKIRLDVMSSVMAALGHNPEASQLFFSGGPSTTIEMDGQKVTVSERMKYLVQDRQWGVMTDPTNGANLGAALEAATAEIRDDGEGGRTSAQLASQLFTVIADRTGDGSDNFGPINDDGWQMWEGARPALADIVASYSTDLFRIGRPDSNADDLSSVIAPENDLYLRGMPYGAAMSRDQMAKVLGTLAYDDENMDEVLAGLAVASKLRMSRAFEDALHDGGSPSAPAALFQGRNIPGIVTASNESAATIGWVLNAGYSARLDKEEVDKKNAEMMSKMFDAFTSIPGVGPAGEWSKFAFEQTTSMVSDQIGQSEATATDDYNTLGPAQESKLEQGLLDQMLANGYFDQKYFDEANGGPGSTRYQPPPPGAIDDGPPPHFDYDSDAYQKWLRDGFPMDAMLNTNVYTPFEKGLKTGHDLAGGG